jgi:UDPglucose 6-dehydrogenase
MIITIIGKGFVGKATGLLECDLNTIWYYDINPNLCYPSNLSIEDINSKSDLIFISVPTPMNIDGSCNTSIIDNLLLKLNHPFIIIRSTIPIGYCNTKNVYFMPEFLTEKNWQNDFYNNSLWIFGYPFINSKFNNLIYQLIDNAFLAQKIKSNNILFCPNSEAEFIKLIRNNFLATKVSFFNEMFDLCSLLNLDYSIIQKGISFDSRIGISHSYIDPNIRGYGGTCFPKDVNNLYSLFHKNNLHSYLLEANLYRNEYIDRKNKDWLINYNRSMTKIDHEIILLISNKNNFIIQDLLNIHYKFIYIGNDNSLQNSKIIYKNCNLNFKLFVPIINKLYYFHNNNLKLYQQFQELLNIINYVKTFNIESVFYFENIVNNHIFMELILEDISLKSQVIMIEHF